MNKLLLPTLLLSALLSAVVAQSQVSNHNQWQSFAIGSPGIAVGGTAAGVVEGLIYMVGGKDASGNIISDNQIYDPATNTWLPQAKSFPNPLFDGTAAVVKNILYIIGGSPDGRTFTGAVWMFNPKTNRWVEGPTAMPTPRVGAVAVVSGNLIYVIGGYNGEYLDTVESYNTSTHLWNTESLEPLLVGKTDITAGLFGTRIVAADGYASNGDHGDNEAYDITTNAPWTSLASDPNPRNGACSGVIGSNLYVAGGLPNGVPPATGVTEYYNPSKNIWSKPLSPMPTAAAVANGSVVYSGKLYCFAGTGQTYEPVQYVQIYQP